MRSFDFAQDDVGGGRSPTSGINDPDYARDGEAASPPLRDLAKGDDGAARGNLETALRIKPDLAAAHFLLSQVEARAGNFGTALEHAATVTQIAGEDPLGWYNLGTVLYAQKNYEIAASALERAASLQSNYGNALFLLGLSYYRLDRREDALAALKVVAALNPGDARLGEMIAALEAGRSLEPISK